MCVWGGGAEHSTQHTGGWAVVVCWAAAARGRSHNYSHCASFGRLTVPAGCDQLVFCGRSARPERSALTPSRHSGRRPKRRRSENCAACFAVVPMQKKACTREIGCCPCVIVWCLAAGAGRYDRMSQTQLRALVWQMGCVSGSERRTELHTQCALNLKPLPSRAEHQSAHTVTALASWLAAQSFIMFENTHDSKLHTPKRRLTLTHALCVQVTRTMGRAAAVSTLRWSRATWVVLPSLSSRLRASMRPTSRSRACCL